MNTVLAGLIYKSCAVYLNDTASELLYCRGMMKAEMLLWHMLIVLCTSLKNHTQHQRKSVWLLFGPYIEGLHVIIFSDHNSLRWLMSCPKPTGRIARWSLRLQDFDFSVVHKPCERNKVTVALSRNPLPATDAPMDLLPEYAVIGSLDLCA